MSNVIQSNGPMTGPWNVAYLDTVAGVQLATGGGTIADAAVTAVSADPAAAVAFYDGTSTSGKPLGALYLAQPGLNPGLNGTYATGLFANFVQASGGGLSSLAWASNTVTATASAALPWAVGTQVNLTISGAVPAGYNGTFLATVTGSTTFTYPLASNPGTETTPGSFSPATSGKAQITFTGTAA